MGRASPPIRAAGEQPGLVALGTPQPGGDRPRPRPAQPVERLGRGPGALALRPIALERGEQGRGGRAQEQSCFLVAFRRLQAKGEGQPLGRRHREARRMDEGEQFQQVEPIEIGIAEPVADQRRVQHDHWRFRRARHRRAAADRLDPAVFMRDPDAAMGCVERRIRQ